MDTDLRILPMLRTVAEWYPVRVYADENLDLVQTLASLGLVRFDSMMRVLPTAKGLELVYDADDAPMAYVSPSGTCGILI